MLHDFTRDNPNLPPDQLIERILELFSDVPNDQRAIEFNLTISGFYEGSLFSHLLNIKTGNSKNLKAETENLVFNGSITGTEITHQALISMNRFLRAREKNEIENLEEMVEFEERFLIHSLKNLYMQFRVNTDARFEMIGGGMDYCVITKIRSQPILLTIQLLIISHLFLVMNTSIETHFTRIFNFETEDCQSAGVTMTRLIMTEKRNCFS
ncbi:MAG: hypothetical protein IPQ11_08435 [Bacteroidetes bacterium]|nr:hypothetical protein [Bacteroidota bacterium]